MGFFDWFSSGSKAAEKVLDASIRGLDALVFTDEERAELNKQLGAQWLELQKVIGNESSIRSVTRRVIACAIIFPFIALVIAAAIAYPYSASYAAFLVSLAESKFGWLVLGVGGFYFGPYLISRALGAKNSGEPQP